MRLGRRAFLQRTGLALAAFGVSEASFLSWADHYHQALAQPTRRKLALLVGIDQYPDLVCDFTAGQGVALQGCVTDVALQQELLIHRFGFQPADILTLTNQQATRQGITDAFQSHLAEQARFGDVVVFHFSGYGSQIRLDSQPEALRNSLVPVDGYLPTEDNPIISDLLEDTLALLLKLLKTQQVTTVLDLGHADLGKTLWGNLRVRSRPNIPTGQLGPRELALQTTLRTRTKTVQTGIVKQPVSLPGTVIAAATPEGIAVEGQWQGFSAGVLTYALTQHLWHATPATTLQVALGRTTETIQQWVGPNLQPQLKGQRREDVSLPVYDSILPAGTTADGIVSEVGEEGKSFLLWLGGLSGDVLRFLGPNSRLKIALQEAPFAAPNQASSPPGRSAPYRTLQIRGRNGLTAQARLELSDGWTPQVGQRVYESVRSLPRNIDLVVALDSSLERIERVDATSALSGLSFVSYITAGEQSADCLLGKVQDTGGQTLTASLPTDGETLDNGVLTSPKAESPSKKGYGLFSPARKLIPGSLANEDEAIKTAVHRLNPQLQTLLAAKLLRLTHNQGSSRLAVRATLERLAPEESVLMKQQTVRSRNPIPDLALPSPIPKGGQTPQLSPGSRIRFRLNNFSDRLLYVALIGFDSAGRAVVFYPDLPSDEQSDEGPPLLSEGNSIQPGAEVIVPQAAADWMVGNTSRWIETHLVFSIAPLSRTIDALLSLPNAAANTQRISPLPKPLTVAQAVLSDLNRASAAISKDDPPSLDAYALDVDAWATLSFVYQVV
ncbi:MAG: caspase family protein [Leptolyngbyaceae cyanobacterium MO_188.B28]|nr:caspase family protein [Leptolyngbyaceae cyanobacterium MO_188.B28]